MRVTYSVIVPIHNEASRVSALVESYREALSAVFSSWELLLVVNGSQDASFDVALEEGRKDERVRAFHVSKPGWGRAVKHGLGQAQGQYLCYTNGARTKVTDLVLALRYAAVNEDVVVKASRIIRESWLRKLGSTLYNLECRLLFRIPVWDVNGTPKVIPRKILAQLPPLEHLSDGDLIDAQLLTWCFHSGIHLLEMPVLSLQRLGGKSTTNWRSAVKMYAGLLALRRRGRDSGARAARG